MIVTIAKHFTFDAAHQLSGLPPDHKCSRLHGHTYSCEIQLRGEPDARGFLIDYADIATVWQTIHDKIDHRYLNEIPGLEISSTEILAAWIWNHLLLDRRLWNGQSAESLLHRVRVSESSTTWAEVGG